MKKRPEKRPGAAIPRRMKTALGRALLFSMPTIVISILVQGYREFRPELETEIKYRRIMRKIKKKG